MDTRPYLKGPDRVSVLRDPVVGARESAIRMEYAKLLIPPLSRSLISAGFPHDEIVVVSSVAHGLANEDSDLDIALVSNSIIYPKEKRTALLINLLLSMVNVQPSLGPRPEFDVDLYARFTDIPDKVYGVYAGPRGFVTFETSFNWVETIPTEV